MSKGIACSFDRLCRARWFGMRQLSLILSIIRHIITNSRTIQWFIDAMY